MKKILIIANFCRAFDGKVDGRFLYLAEMLAKEKDMDVELITSDFSHATKKKKSAPKQEAYRTKLTLLEEPGYIKHAGLKRLYSHYVWGKNVYSYVKSIEKLDCVYCAMPSLTASYLLADYCEKYHIPFIVDVQDLWPEATFMLIKNKLFQLAALPMKWYANRSYSAADYIVAVSNTYVKRVQQVNRKSKAFANVFLGNDGGRFDVARDLSTTQRDDKEIRIGYIGTLSHSYDIKCVISAIAMANQKNPSMNIKFVVMGDGPLKVDFEEFAQLKAIRAEFTGRLLYDEMVSKLCSCDIVVNPIVKGSAASIINKVGDYALAGLPVINTQESPEYRQLIDKYKCGINCEVGNASQVADAIVRLASNKELMTQMGKASRKLGEELFDRRNTYQHIVDLIKKAVKE